MPKNIHNSSSTNDILEMCEYEFESGADFNDFFNNYPTADTDFNDSEGEIICIQVDEIHRNQNNIELVFEDENENKKSDGNMNKKQNFLNGYLENKGTKIKLTNEITKSETEKNRRKRIYKHNADTLEKKWKCFLCQRRFSTLVSKKRHYNLHFGKNPPMCPCCGKLFFKEYEVLKHFVLHQTKQKHSKFLTKRKIKTKSEIATRPVLENGKYHEIPLVCTFCSVLLTPEILLDHALVHFQIEKKNSCPICLKTFSTTRMWDVKRHLLLHTGIKNYKCNQCSKSFYEKSVLQNHYSVHTKEKKFKCPLCARSFGYAKSVRYHYQVVHTTSRIQCTECMRQFSTPELLRKHLRIHNPDKSYQCQVCFKEIYYKINFERHLQRHMSATKPKHQCDTCNRTFRSKLDLLRHKQGLHTSGKEYQCDSCSDIFLDKWSLNRHNKTYHKESIVEQYECSVCQKTFSRKSNMILHEKAVHSTIYLQCQICNKTFRHSRYLEQHLKAHIAGSVFKCSVCPAQYKTRKGCVQHTRRKHPKQDIEIRMKEKRRRSHSSMINIKKELEFVACD